MNSPLVSNKKYAYQLTASKQLIYLCALSCLFLACLWQKTVNAATPNCSNSIWSVDNSTEFNQAITCFNRKRDTNNYTINLNANILLSRPSISIQNTQAKLTINGNDKKIDGQGIDNIRPIDIATDTTVFMNHIIITRGNQFNGGGIQNKGTLTLKQSTIHQSAGSYGAGIRNQGMLTVIDSTISNNSANVGGGGIHNSSGAQLKVINSTISGNKAKVAGGGVYVSSNSTAKLINSTISNNMSDGAGGGIFNNGNTLTMINTLVANNQKISGTDSTPNDCDCRGSFEPSNSINNLIQDGRNACRLTNGTHGNIIDVTDDQLRLAPLTDNGGVTQTHALLLGSLAFEAGTTTEAPAFDQRGISRTNNGAPDIGAYEAQTFNLTLIKNGGSGSLIPEPGIIRVMKDAQVAITAAPINSLVQWGESCANASGNSCTITMDTNKTVTVTFKDITFSLTTSILGDGHGTINIPPSNSNDGKYIKNTRLELNSTPDSNSIFVQWGGACSGTNTTCNLIMDDNKAVTAEFKKKIIVFSSGFESP